MRSSSRLLLLSLALPACTPSHKSAPSSVSDTGDSASSDVGDATGDPLDRDGDGVLVTEDCDDADPSVGSLEEDDDCDGVVTEEDCDDGDWSIGSREEDADCDGAVTEEDCDDGDPTMGSREEDADCDGTLTNEDCDDTDPLITIIPGDADCDGILVEEDCDDDDPSIGSREEDDDCDGAVTEDDCDDADPSVGSREQDADCDGAITEDDCNDDDPTVYPGAPETELLSYDDAACDGGGGSLALADFAFIGEHSEDFAGLPVRTAGDVDGDGLDDIFVSASTNSDGGRWAGKAYLILGSTLADSAASNFDLSQADFTFIGENRSDLAGYSLGTAGDVDGDGLDDLLVGAAYANTYSDGNPAGKAYLILGSTLADSTASTIELSQADFTFSGGDENDYSGATVSTAGDVDGDGLDDLFIGAHKSDDGGYRSGTAYLILGSTLASSSSPAIDLDDADFAFIGENSDDFAGFGLSTAGDVDGDGLDDLLVGAHKNDDGGTDAGKAYLILGSTLTATTSTTIDLSQADFAFIGEDSDDDAGREVSTAGDVDGDGLDDLLVGAAYANSRGAGTAYLILGSTLTATTSSTIDLMNADVAFVGEEGDNAGYSVTTAGDVDGDGIHDIIVGASGNDEGGSDAGKAYLVLGSTLADTTSSTVYLRNADFGFIGERRGDYAGASVSTAGDVNGDGLDDLLVGAVENDDGGRYAGKAYLILSHL